MSSRQHERREARGPEHQEPRSYDQSRRRYENNPSGGCMANTGPQPVTAASARRQTRKTKRHVQYAKPGPIPKTGPSELPANTKL